MYDKEKINLISKLLMRSIPTKIVHIPDYDAVNQEKTLYLYLELLDKFKGNDRFQIIETPTGTLTFRVDSFEEMVLFFEKELDKGKAVKFYSFYSFEKEDGTTFYNVRCYVV